MEQPVKKMISREIVFLFLFYPFFLAQSVDNRAKSPNIGLNKSNSWSSFISLPK